MTELLDQFLASLADVGATSNRVTAADAEAAIAEAVIGDAVGVPLPFEGVSLPDGVDTDLSPSTLRDADTGITPAALGVAARGSILVRSRPAGDEPVSLYPARHVAVVAASDVVADLAAAMEWLAAEFDAGRDSYVFATGPSATADMGALVEGVHGPTEVNVIVLEDR